MASNIYWTNTNRFQYAKFSNSFSFLGSSSYFNNSLFEAAIFLHQLLLVFHIHSSNTLKYLHRVHIRQKYFLSFFPLSVIVYIFLVFFYHILLFFMHQNLMFPILIQILLYWYTLI